MNWTTAGTIITMYIFFYWMQTFIKWVIVKVFSLKIFINCVNRNIHRSAEHEFRIYIPLCVSSLVDCSIRGPQFNELAHKTAVHTEADNNNVGRRWRRQRQQRPIANRPFSSHLPFRSFCVEPLWAGAGAGHTPIGISTIQPVSLRHFLAQQYHNRQRQWKTHLPIKIYAAAQCIIILCYYDTMQSIGLRNRHRRQHQHQHQRYSLCEPIQLEHIMELASAELISGRAYRS